VKIAPDFPGQAGTSGVLTVVNANDPNPTGPIGPETLSCLVDCHAAALELFARQLCDMAPDVVQEAFVELAGQDETPRDVLAWLYCVVRNKALSAARAARRRKRHEAEAAARKSAWFVPAASDVLDAQAVAAALASLDPEHREVIVARLWGGLTFQQIARMLGVTDSTAHRRYESALRLLREKMRIPCPKNE
jgi:RNA polymerase sigma-70 factor (ECF subfamily)